MRMLGLLLIFFSISGCESSNQRRIDHHIIDENSHLGEYLQLESSETLITVKRDSNGGLVRVHLKNESTEILDAQASEARDILVSNQAIAYRINQSIRIWFRGKIIEFSAQAERLRYFHSKGDQFTVAWDQPDKQTKWRRLNEGLTTIAEGSLTGSPRASINRGDKSISAIQTSTGLSLCTWNEEGCNNSIDVDQGKLGSYVTLREIEGSLKIAYFDESLGILKLAQEMDGKFTIVKVDGDENQTYRGMDIAIFMDRNQRIGLIYLDAWALKLRLARQSKDGVWTSEVLPIAGALGFYSQIIEETERRLKVGFHSFRTDHTDRRQSFEDLIIAEIYL